MINDAQAIKVRTRFVQKEQNCPMRLESLLSFSLSVKDAPHLGEWPIVIQDRFGDNGFI
jgi:hypothetical protein